MFLVRSCSCLCPIHLSQMLRQEWRCSWSNAKRRCSNNMWVIWSAILLPIQVCIILEVWQYLTVFKSLSNVIYKIGSHWYTWPGPMFTGEMLSQQEPNKLFILQNQYHLLLWEVWKISWVWTGWGVGSCTCWECWLWLESKFLHTVKSLI